MYDINGNVISGTTDELKELNVTDGIVRVMSYNVGSWYDGGLTIVPTDKYDKFLKMHKYIIDKYKPHMIIFQEYMRNISSGKLATDLLNNYYLYNSATCQDTVYLGKCVSTNFKVLSSTFEYFQNAPSWKGYQKSIVIINNREVCVISAHLALSEQTCIDEISELISVVEDYDYFIIGMDSNLHAENSDLYNRSFKLFENKGYKVCNKGEYITYPDTNGAIDNIVVSNNINIKSVMVDSVIKDEALENTNIAKDHYPIITYLEVY